MEKNALLPIKFYPALSWTDYDRFTKNMGGDFTLLKEHNLYLPAFQMTIPDIGRHWGILDFTTIDLINYDDGSVIDILSAAPTGYFNRDPIVYNKAGDFRALVNFRFPLDYDAQAKIPVGKYYYHLSDGETEWESEVFELCDFGLDALTAEFNNEANFDTFTSSYDSDDEDIDTTFCKTTTGAGDASAYTELEVFLEEELDLYVATTGLVGCAASDWNVPLFLELRDATGQVVSDVFTIDTINTQYTFTLKSFVGGTVRLYMWTTDADQTKGSIEIWVQRRYTAGHNQIRYSNDKNFCKIFYEDDYENVFFIDSKQVIDQQVLDENVVEDDQANKYPIIATNQKWNSLQFASGEAMLNAMSLMRIHDNRKIIRETGEIMDIVEIFMEQSVLDYEAALIKLVYREASCSNEACGFDDCCPTLETPIMQEIYSGLPAAAAGNSGWYALDETAGDQYRMYLSDGAAWNLVTTWDIADNCIEARQNSYSGNRFFWYDSGVSRWRLFIDLATVADATGGIATLTSDIEHRDALTVRGEYEDSDGVWNECTDEELLVTSVAAVLSCNSGAGTFNFRLHIKDDSCDYGYSNVVAQTIT